MLPVQLMSELKELEAQTGKIDVTIVGSPTNVKPASCSSQNISYSSFETQ
jgi:hypothetical protein